ncbi:hypothetical protein L1047_09070 [Synechococcus sp. Nb3U1]|nr:hypothetical protein [Synechococcus sp. Nb3U1]MCF2971342.1 hypothetical protein [Synechococcus sp. Nb3U1]
MSRPWYDYKQRLQRVDALLTTLMRPRTGGSPTARATASVSLRGLMGPPGDYRAAPNSASLIGYRFGRRVAAEQPLAAILHYHYAAGWFCGRDSALGGVALQCRPKSVSSRAAKRSGAAEARAVRLLRLSVRTMLQTLPQ